MQFGLKILILATLLFGFLGHSLNSNTVYANAGDGCGDGRETFLNIPYWDRGLDSCEELSIDDPKNSPIAIIINNIIAIILTLAGYVAVAFVIVGGFHFVLSSGDPQKAVYARKTVINALIGAVIAIMGRIITEVIYNNLTT